MPGPAPTYRHRQSFPTLAHSAPRDQAKLANLHFALGLQRAFDRAGLAARSLAAHPGLARTDLQARSVREQGGPLTRFFERLQHRTGMSAADGALPQLRAATDPAAPGGGFYGPLWVNTGPPVPKPVLRVVGLERSIRMLWAVSERETGIALDVAAATGQQRG